MQKTCFITMLNVCCRWAMESCSVFCLTTVLNWHVWSFLPLGSIWHQVTEMGLWLCGRYKSKKIHICHISILHSSKCVWVSFHVCLCMSPLSLSSKHIQSIKWTHSTNPWCIVYQSCANITRFISCMLRISYHSIGCLCS